MERRSRRRVFTECAFLAVDRIVAAAEKMIESLDGVPFGLTIDEVAPNSIRIESDESVYELALALDPGLERTVTYKLEELERVFQPSALPRGPLTPLEVETAVRRPRHRAI